MIDSKKSQPKVIQPRLQPVANKRIFEVLVKKASQPIQPVQPK